MHLPFVKQGDKPRLLNYMYGVAFTGSTAHSNSSNVEFAFPSLTDLKFRFYSSSNGKSTSIRYMHCRYPGGLGIYNGRRLSSYIDRGTPN